MTSAEPCDLCRAASGRYQLTRLCCCARLVGSARPNKARASAMLAVIHRTSGTPSRAEILAAVAALKP